MKTFFLYLNQVYVAHKTVLPKMYTSTNNSVLNNLFVHKNIRILNADIIPFKYDFVDAVFLRFLLSHLFGYYFRI